MQIFYIERRLVDVPGDDEWLSGDERQWLARLRFPKRRDDWRLGRWTAKCAIAALRPEAGHLGGIEVRPQESGAPAVFVRGRPAGFAISLSHSNGLGFCAVADETALIGCDVEAVAPRSPEFLLDYFTPAERAMVATQRPPMRHETVNLLWSAKESVSKAVTMGLRLSLQSVVVVRADAGGGPGEWLPLAATLDGGAVFRGWWRVAKGFVWTVLSNPHPLSLSELACAGESPPVDGSSSMWRARV
jgi:4'-phosphopantetheinyl transferase